MSVSSAGRFTAKRRIADFVYRRADGMTVHIDQYTEELPRGFEYRTLY